MSQNVVNEGIKNSIFVVISQGVKLVLSIVRTLILPIILGITSFGYWQVYLLYVAYVGIFTYGYNDGLYLKYGKYSYKELPLKKIRSSLRLFIIIEFISLVLISILIFLEPDPNKRIAMLLATINIPILGLSGTYTYIMQVTNQMKKFSVYTLIDKTIMLLLLCAFWFLHSENYIIIIFADIFSKSLILIIMMFSFKELLFGDTFSLSKSYKELKNNISIGFFLLIANLTGMLILGFGRVIVERFENIDIYATYAFSISTINLVLIFIGSIGLVVYPTLSRIDSSLHSRYFVNLDKLVSIIVFLFLVLYYPLVMFIEKYMSAYTGMFEYLPLIFAIVYVQTKMQIVFTPYFKLLRLEKKLLITNLLGFFVSATLIIILYFVFHGVFVVALASLIAMFVRMLYSENLLTKYMMINIPKTTFLEIILIIIFILSCFYFPLEIGFTTHLLLLLTILLLNRKSLLIILKVFKTQVKL